MSAPDRVTFDMLDKVIAGLDREQVNPIDDDWFCLYTSRTDPNHHCIVGQIWHELGLPVPGYSRGDQVFPHVVADRNGTYDIYERGTLSALRDLQARADKLARDGGKPWAAAIDAWPAIRAYYVYEVPA